MAAASTSNVPMIGPVQENDTSASVTAIKKIPEKPRLSARASALLIQEEGSVSSKAPNKDAAKKTSSTKKKKLNNPFVDRSFSASEPNRNVITKPMTTYSTMIDIPYDAAMATVLRLDCAFFVK